MQRRRTSSRRVLRSVGVLAGAVLVLAVAAQAAAGTVTRTSVTPAGGQFAVPAYGDAVSAGGRIVAFETNGDGPGYFAHAVYVRDLAAGATEIASLDSTGAPSTGYDAVVSVDGRYVAFVSDAALVPADTNAAPDVYLRDRQAGRTWRVSIATGGVQGDGWSADPQITPDGRYVVFASDASTLVPGDTNNSPDVFVRDRAAKTTVRVSLAVGGAQGNERSDDPAISADGRYVAFHALASNLVRDDTNGWSDIFVRDRVARTTERVSVSTTGGQLQNGQTEEPAISADGRFVSFMSAAANAVPGDTNGQHDVFLRDRLKGTTRRVSLSSAERQGSWDSGSAVMSANARYIAFVTQSAFGAGDTNGAEDVYLRDRWAGTTVRVSVTSAGVQIATGGRRPAIMPDGGGIVFTSGGPNVVPGDTNGVDDAFIWRR